jgi:hypothetical protein
MEQKAHRYRSPMVPFKVHHIGDAQTLGCERESRQILGLEWMMLVARVTEQQFRPTHFRGAPYHEFLQVHRIDLAPPLVKKSDWGAVESETWSDDWAPYIEAGGLSLGAMMAPCEPLALPVLERCWSIRLLVRNSSNVALTVGLVLSESRGGPYVAPYLMEVDEPAEWQRKEASGG